jgi:CubicO group peptidase (beta-lactamase class C family)
MRRLGTLPLMAQPGERWLYGTSSEVLGVLVARAAGMPLDAFMRERLFTPLRMRDTAFHVDQADLARFATSYLTDPATGALSLYDAPDGQWSHAPVFPSGADGLVSTVDDLVAFGCMMLGQGERVLSRASVATMTANQLTDAQSASWGFADEALSMGFGLGVSVVTKRRSLHENIGRYGWDGGLGTSWFVDPADGVVGVLLTQGAWTSPTAPPVCVDFWTLAALCSEN